MLENVETKIRDNSKKQSWQVVGLVRLFSFVGFNVHPNVWYAIMKTLVQSLSEFICLVQQKRKGEFICAWQVGLGEMISHLIQVSSSPTYMNYMRLILMNDRINRGAKSVNLQINPKIRSPFFWIIYIFIPAFLDIYKSVKCFCNFTNLYYHPTSKRRERGKFQGYFLFNIIF